MKFIVTGDNHLRIDRPLCRLDKNWMATQKSQLDYIVDVANLYKADIIFTGDLFDVPKVPPIVLSIFLDAISILKGKAYIIAGNHSLPYHKEENIMDSTMGVVKTLSEIHPNIVYLPAEEYTTDGRFEHSAPIGEEIAVVHTLTFPKSDEIPFGCKAVSAYQLLDKYSTASWIFTGDYHTDFVVEDDNRFVINPGCMNIQSADMIGYKPCIYYVDTGKRVDVSTARDKLPVYRLIDSEVKKLYIPEDFEVLTRNHLEQKEKRDERIASFVDTIVHKGQIGLSFEDNLVNFLQNNEVPMEVMDIFTELKEEQNG